MAGALTGPDDNQIYKVKEKKWNLLHMKTGWYMLILILASLFVFSAPVIASTFSFTEEDSGKTVIVNPGDAIVVSLKENPSTGYRWVMETSRGLILESDDYLPSQSGLIGAAGVHTWTYLVFSSGTLQISGIYKRPWMPTEGDEQAYTLSIVSGQRSYSKPITGKLGDISPQNGRISLELQKLNGIRRILSGNPS